MEEYQPHYLVIAAGFDTHRADPVGAFQLDTPDFKIIGADLAAIGVPTLICQEGGYALEVLGPTVHTFLKAFQG